MMTDYDLIAETQKKAVVIPRLAAELIE